MMRCEVVLGMKAEALNDAEDVIRFDLLIENFGPHSVDQTLEEAKRLAIKALKRALQLVEIKSTED